MLRINSALDAETDQYVERVIGCCITVHSALGPGFLESVYVRAVGIEFKAQAIPFERERQVQVFYRGEVVSTSRLDVVAADRIVLELKCVERIHPVHHAQLIGYLRASKLRVGLLVNFNVPLLRDGLKRIVL